MPIRVALTDFALANALYSNAQVTVFEVNANLQQTVTLATLYAAPTGGTLRSNPFNLNSEGAFPEVRYVEKPVILRVIPSSGPAETLGVQGQAARFRGTWATGILYYPGERVREPSGPSTYLILTGHTSATFLTDVANLLLELELDGTSIATAAAAIAVTGTVLKAGDTMTGDLAIVKATPQMALDATGLTRARLRFRRGGLLRYDLYLENDAEIGGDVGGSLKLDSATDAGVFKENIWAIARATGVWTFAKSVNFGAGWTFADAAVSRRALGVPAAAPLLTNGAFDVWQSATSLAIAASAITTAAIYAADQWCMETGLVQACVVSRQTGVATRYRARVQRNSGQTGVSVLRFQQPLEIWDVLRLRGRTPTVRATLKAGANFSGAVRAKLLTGTGTEGRRTNAAAYTAEVTALDGALALTTSDQRLAVTAGGAVGSTATQAALVLEWTPSGTAGVDDWFEVEDVWLEFSAFAPEFRENIQQTLARCHRFFWKTPSALQYVSNAAGASQGQYAYLKFPTTMRTSPTMSTTFSSVSNLTTPVVSSISVDMAQPNGLSVAAGLIVFVYDSDNTVDARL